MSVLAWGVLELQSADIPYREIAELAFEATAIATEGRIGVVFGIHIDNSIPEDYRNLRNCLAFELSDHPVNTDVDILFIGDGVSIYHNDQRVDTGESLDSRMTRVQRFLAEILKIEIVKKVILHINGGFGEESTVEIEARDFKVRILEMYKQEGNFAPTVGFIISR